MPGRSCAPLVSRRSLGTRCTRGAPEDKEKVPGEDLTGTRQPDNGPAPSRQVPWHGVDKVGVASHPRPSQGLPDRERIKAPAVQVLRLPPMTPVVDLRCSPAADIV